ncbi:MAG: DUF3226 domain-containing protein [Pseudomonadota bacterium]
MTTGLSIRLAKSIICPHCNTKIDTVPLKILQPKLLVVEGKDEEGFFTALLREANIKDVQVVGIGGKTNTKPHLKALTNDPKFSQIASIGIIRDADADPENTFQSVLEALTAAGLSCPKRPLSFVKGPPKVGIMIIPSHQKLGALEDLCLQAIAADPATPCIEQFFDCLGQQGLPVTRELSKAKVRVFLSSREDPTLSLGTAAPKGYWPLDNRAFESVCKFLQSL